MGYDIVGWSGLTSTATDTSIDHIDHDIVDDGQDRVWSPAFEWHSAPERNAYINGPFVYCPPQINDVPPCVPVPGTGRYVGATCRPECRVIWSTDARPASEHGGGVNVAFGGGRAMFLREDIDYDVYRALMTLNDKKSDSPDPTFMLKDSDFL